MPEFDIVLYGATGFTGTQAAHYFKLNAPKDLKWTIAGRSQSKLENLAESLGLNPKSIIVADCFDRTAIESMVKSTRIIVTTVGPYDKYGAYIIEYCCKHGRHYLDITGETPFIRDMIEAWEDKAKESGAKLIPFSGFDSVPSDIGVYYTVQQMKKRGKDLSRVESYFKLKGGFNGGTIASAINLAESGRDKDLMKPLLLTPKDMQTDAEKKESYQSFKVKYVPELKGWSPPFFMSPINSVVVRRSYALYRKVGFSYGESFRYHERLAPMKSRFKARLVAGGSMAFGAAIHTSLGRKLASRMAPSPGEGPRQEDIEGGFFSNAMICRDEESKQYKSVIKAKGDPGNRVTVTALCESALCLAIDEDNLENRDVTGFLTPAFAFGQHLITRLEKAGFSFSFSELN